MHGNGVMMFVYLGLSFNHGDGRLLGGVLLHYLCLTACFLLWEKNDDKRKDG